MSNDHANGFADALLDDIDRAPHLGHRNTRAAIHHLYGRIKMYRQRAERLQSMIQKYEDADAKRSN